MSDYTWLAQPIATVSAAVLALGAATIAYLAAQAGVREQRRIAVRREVFDAFDALMQQLLQLATNAQHFIAYRPKHDAEPSEHYTNAIEASPSLVRKVIFSAHSVKLLGFLEIADMALDVVSHFGAAQAAVRQAVFAKEDESARVYARTANDAVKSGQEQLSRTINRMENELRTSGPDAKD